MISRPEHHLPPLLCGSLVGHTDVDKNLLNIGNSVNADNIAAETMDGQVDLE
jgi:hypothetical protein